MNSSYTIKFLRALNFRQDNSGQAYLGCCDNTGYLPSVSAHDLTKGIDDAHGLGQSAILCQGS